MKLEVPTFHSVCTIPVVSYSFSGISVACVFSFQGPNGEWKNHRHAARSDNVIVINSLAVVSFVTCVLV